MEPIIQYVLVGINLVALFLYGIDKLKAKWAKRRISEKTLLAIAAIGGSVGALAGMLFFRHKISKTLFRVSIPLFLIAHIFAIWKLFYR